MKTQKEKKALKKTRTAKVRPAAQAGKTKLGHPKVGHGRHLWKSDADFKNFMAILNENSKR